MSVFSDMTRVLVTGGSGYIGRHILDSLLQRGHNVVATVRSADKAHQIRTVFPSFTEDRLAFAVVPDISVRGAFDQAIVADPPLGAVIHTASPVHISSKDIQREVLDPAINGTIGMLHSIKKLAPSVRRVVITSSFASIFDPSLGCRPGYVYSEKDWNPVTAEEAVLNAVSGYEASKTFAEKAAWDFVLQERPTFTLSTICPPMVMGPSIPDSSSASLGFGNQVIYNIVHDQSQQQVPPNFLFCWVDVRDLALCHVLAVERDGAANQRFLVGGPYSNREIADIVRAQLSQGSGLLGMEKALGGDYPDGGVYGVDARRAVEVFGIEWRSLTECVMDTIHSFAKVDDGRPISTHRLHSA